MTQQLENMPITEIEIAYGGEAYADNQIDAKTLGEALTSLSALIEHAEKIINGETAEPKVNIKATKEGSFTLLVAVMGSIKTINALGLVAGGGVAAGGVLGIIEWLKGRKISSIVVDEQKDTAEIEVDGEKVKCSNDIQKLITSPIIRKELDKLIYKPLQTEKPSTFSVSQQKHKVVRVTQAEAVSFKTAKSTFVEKTHVTTRQANVHFANVRFKQGKSWDIILPNGEEVSASMKDEAFLERVEHNQAAFCKGDLFVVELTETTNETNGALSKPRYSITKVIRHRAAADRKLL
ncbi:hypothetical protein WE708_003168 [Escherichia coli H26]